MKNTKLKTALASVTLAAAALAVSLPAQAQDYRNCNDTTNSVAGGLIGGSVGAVAGREIAGRGDRSEGTIIGAIIGGIAGAAIGDGASDCEKDFRFNDNRRVATNNRFQTVGFNDSRRNRTTVNYGYDRSFDRRAEALYRIDREIDQTRYENDRLKQRIRYSRGNARGLRRTLEANIRQLDYLKKERKRIKKGNFSRNDFRRNDFRSQSHRGY